MTRAGARQEGGEANSGTGAVGEARGGIGQTVNGAARLVGQLVQEQVPAQSQGQT